MRSRGFSDSPRTKAPNLTLGCRVSLPFQAIDPAGSKRPEKSLLQKPVIVSYNETMSKIRVNMISETEFTVKGHGVHTAYVEITEALKKNPMVEVEVNGRGEYDVVHIQTMGLYSMKWLFKRGVKKIISAHLVPDSFLGSLRGADKWRWAARLYLKWFYARADLVLACSGSVRQELEQDMKLTNTDVLYNSIDMSRYQRTPEDRENARLALGIPKERIVIMGNGQIQPRKRFDLFYSMAVQRPECLFVWVGGIPFGQLLGADANKMQRYVDTAPQNLLVTGIIDLSEVRRYYHAADIFTLPAEQENHPMCVLEAAGTGLPILLRDIRNYKDTFSGGALMAKDDETFLTDLDRLVQDPVCREEWAEKSKLIRDRFDSANSALRLIGFYKELLLPQI